MLSKEESQRLNVLRFPLIVGVVFIHAYGSDVGFSGGSIGLTETNTVTDFVRNLISQGISRTAVPLFFLMSGYLFFLGFQGSRDEYFSKISSRVKTLLIPFLIWNISTLLVLAIAQSLPSTQEFFSGKNARISSFDLFDYINAIFGLDRSPISYQFWFIRDLIVLVIFSPVAYFIINRIPVIFLSFLLACWFTNIWPLFSPSAEATLFFSIGATVACKDKSLFRLDNFAIPIIIAYIFTLSIDIFLTGLQFGQYVHRVGIILGVLAFLSLSKKIVLRPKLNNALITFGATSFFVFAGHEPLLTVVKKIAFKIIQPSSNFSILALYFLIPTFVVFLLVVTYHFFAKKMPIFTRVIAGGR